MFRTGGEQLDSCGLETNANGVMICEGQVMADEVDREAGRNPQEGPQDAATLGAMTAEAAAGRVAGGKGAWWRPVRPNR